MKRPPRAVIDAFFPHGAVVGSLGAGNINDTFKVKSGSQSFVLQRINPAVFDFPKLVAQRLAWVHKVMNSKAITVPVPRSTHGGEIAFIDDTGGTWRCYVFVEGVTPPTKTERDLRACGRAFGQYIKGIAFRYSAHLPPTTYRLHDFDYHYAELRRARKKDPFARADAASRDIDDVLRLADTIRALPEYELWDLAPVRVVHNDAKPLNLIMRADRRMHVIDVDTTAPGQLLFDVGELVRACGHTPERAAALWNGFHDGWSQRLRISEYEALPIAGSLMTVENALRRMKDHLSGDVYFRTLKPGDNRTKARQLVASARAQLKQLDELRDQAEVFYWERR